MFPMKISYSNKESIISGSLSYNELSSGSCNLNNTAQQSTTQDQSPFWTSHFTKNKCLIKKIKTISLLVANESLVSATSSTDILPVALFPLSDLRLRIIASKKLRYRLGVRGRSRRGRRRRNAQDKTPITLATSSTGGRNKLSRYEMA